MWLPPPVRGLVTHERHGRVLFIMATPLDLFTYEHATVKGCIDSGCTRGHLKLKDLAESIGRGWIGDRKGLNLRDRIRPAVVIGRVIKGTRSVPSAEECVRNAADRKRKDLRKDMAVGCASRTLASLSTGRVDWYWHIGDPDVLVIKRLLIAEIPADPALGQDCTICLGSNVLDTQNVEDVYWREDVCQHAFHKTCIMDWFRQCLDAGQDTTCPLCVRSHPISGGNSAIDGRPPGSGEARADCGDAAPGNAAVACGGAGACGACGGAVASGATASASPLARVRAIVEDGSAQDERPCGVSTLPADVADAAKLAVRIAPASRSTRKRPIGDLDELPDASKNSLSVRRAAAFEREPRWEVGDAIEARWGSRKGGTKWYRGRVVRVHTMGTPAADLMELRSYDVHFDDGDTEDGVMAKHVRAQRN